MGFNRAWTFFRKNLEHWLQQFQYHEAGPHLLLQAFLQRIVNSGGVLSENMVWDINGRIYWLSGPILKVHKKWLLS